MNLSKKALPEPAAERSAGTASGGAELITLLGRASYFEGKLAFEGTVQVQGVFVGDIRSKDTLVVGEGGRVQGRVDVGTLVVHGEVAGEVRARELVEMHPPARVRGTVQTPVLVVDRGVVFEGSTRMENLDAPAKEQSAPPPARPTA